MSIERLNKWYVPTCDMCGEELAPTTDFYDAVEAKKDAGWKSVEDNGEWIDLCDCCRGEE